MSAARWVVIVRVLVCSAYQAPRSPAGSLARSLDLIRRLGGAFDVTCRI